MVILVLGLVACARTASADLPATPPEAIDASVDIPAVEAEIRQSLTVISATERTMTPHGAQLLGAHGASLVTTFRHIAEKRDGAAVGVRLFGIRPGSLASKFGLESGDRVDSIIAGCAITPAP